MAQGQIDHPSYLTRQMMTFKVAANTALTLNFPWDIRIRSVIYTVVTAGTSGGKATIIGLGTSITYPNVPSVVIGTATGQIATATAITTNTSTTTLGTATTATSTAGVYQNLGDLNVKIPAGQQLQLSATDTQLAYNAALEFYIDPQSASWTGQN